MAIDSPKLLVETLGRVPLLDPAQQATLAKELLPRCTDTQALARQLLERGWLTPYQLNRLLHDRAGELVVGPYVLLERLGEGGTGEVFKARHHHMSRLIALKLVRKEALADKETLGRFQREIHALAQLEHPNVIHAYDAGPVGGNFFLAMEYVEGIDLQRLVKQKGPLPIDQACEYLRQTAAGLQYIHERGLVHRDIKPSNLLVSTKGIIKILDLGLARLQRPIDHSLTAGLTATGAATMGTLDYLSPEQALDFHTADIRSDLYSLGCTFYFLLAGKAPFEGGTAAQILLQHQQKEPAAIETIRPDVPANVAQVLRRLMAKSPTARFQQPKEVIEVLGHPGAVLSRRPRSLGMSPLRMGIAASAVLLLAVCLVVALASRSKRPGPSSPVAVRPFTTAATRAELPRTYLLNVNGGQMTNDNMIEGVPVLEGVPELGGKAMKVPFGAGGYVGVNAASVRNWKPFATLRLDLFNPSKTPIGLNLTIRHAGSTDYFTRVDVPVPLSPGKNEVKFDLARLTNTNGSPPDLANVVRWYIATAENKPVTVYVGNVWLEGNTSAAKGK